jgi:hypothetical protein
MGNTCYLDALVRMHESIVVESAASHQPPADYPVLGTFPRSFTLPMGFHRDIQRVRQTTSTTMSSELNLKPVKNEASSSRPQPTASILKPWEFDYTPSKDGKDLNLLIMFHGLGKSLYSPMSRAKV